MLHLTSNRHKSLDFVHCIDSLPILLNLSLGS